MLLRRLLPLLALLGLVLAGPHAAAMAMPMMQQAVSVEAQDSPCHQEQAVEKPAKAAEKPSCCADGCQGQCTPLLAFLSVAPELISETAPVVVTAELRTPAPESAPFGQDRPPRAVA